MLLLFYMSLYDVVVGVGVPGQPTNSQDNNEQGKPSDWIHSSLHSTTTSKLEDATLHSFQGPGQAKAGKG